MFFTAVPRSTQPSTLRRTVKWVSAFGHRNNKMAMVDVDGSSPSCLAWSKGLAAIWVCIHQVNDGSNGWTLAMASSHDDSTINTVICITITTISSDVLLEQLPSRHIPSQTYQPMQDTIYPIRQKSHKRERGGNKQPSNDNMNGSEICRPEVTNMRSSKSGAPHGTLGHVARKIKNIL